jgi:lysophospholipase L1-like esterase
VLRVVCLGDSFTFGWGIGDAGAYPLQLEALLAADLGPGRVEVTNLGMPDFNTSNELRAWRKLARPLAPDVVVLGWYLNDVQPDNLGPRYTDSWLFRALGCGLEPE